MGGGGGLQQKQHYTIHAHYSTPIFFELYKSIKIFTGQGVERNNDMARGVILRKSNKWDSAGDVLRQEQRHWKLHGHERDSC